MRLATQVYPDGSVGRQLELRLLPDPDEAAKGRPAEGLGDSGVILAEPDAWSSVDEGPGWLRAEGFFTAVAELPALVAFDVGGEPRRARIDTRLAIDERVVLTRFSYAETHGDPYSSADSARGLDGLVQLVIDTLNAELRAQFGDDLETRPAEAFLRGEARALAWAMLAVNRGAAGWERTEMRGERWVQLLRQHGLPLADLDEPDAFWSTEMPVILDWLRAKVAAALSTTDEVVRPGELSFWPAGEDWERQMTAITERVWGSEDELYALLEPHLAALAGFYGGDDAPRVRFESRVRMPGVVLRTNGTPDEDSIVWLFRQQELTAGDLPLEAQSVEPVARALTDAGARREFDRASLLRLADILFRQDGDGRLTALLARAVERGKLEVLRDDNDVPPELQSLARELADLLDPEVPLPEPL